MSRRPSRKGPVTVTCTTCGWTATAGTWRPAKRLLAAHVAKLHPPSSAAEVLR
jgi:hypothetical protein